MTELIRDQNFVTVAGGVSNTSSSTVLPFKIDSITGRLLADSPSMGTVTSVATGTGLTGGTITTTGTISLAVALQPMATLTGNSLKVLRVNAGETAVEYATVGAGTVTSVTSTDANATVATTTTTPVITIVSAPKLQTARTIGGVSFDGTANITVSTATGGFTISGGDLALAANNITMTGSLGATGARLTKGWFTDLQVTNAISGSITGNAATVTTNANLTGVITSVGNATSIASQTGTGTKFVMDTSPALVTPLLGTPTSGVLTNCTGLPAASVVAGTFGTGAYVMDTKITVPQVINTSNAITASGNAATVPITSRISTVTNNSAATLTITMTTTSAVDGQMVMVRVLDFSAVAQTITWVNTENSTVTAPVTSNGSTTLPLTVGFQYNAATSKWRCIASA